MNSWLRSLTHMVSGVTSKVAGVVLRHLVALRGPWVVELVVYPYDASPTA